MSLTPRVKQLLGAALIAALLGMSMSLSLADALTLPIYPWRILAVCAGTAAICALTAGGKKSALVALGLLVFGGALLLIRGIYPLAILRETAVSLANMFSGGGGSLADHALVLSVLLALVLTLAAFLLTRLSGGVYPALLVFIFVLMGGWFMEKRLNPLYIAPGLVALAVLFASAYREGFSYMKAVPTALIAALLAVMLTPTNGVTWQPLADAAEKVRDLFEDYFLFTDPRTVYSVSSDGYQPQGELLGGPASPRDADVMLVKTDHDLLMRGAVRRTYTGRSWMDGAVNSRYLYIDPTRRGLRNAIFDLDMVDSLKDALITVEASVEMLNPGTSTLFVPHRLRSLSMAVDLVAYYNNSGEVFITREVDYGDSYALTAYLPEAPDDTMIALVNAAQDVDDPDYDTVVAGYMNLPTGMEEDVYWLTQRVIEGAQTPYEKALAIFRHLRGGDYRYMMNVEYPPPNRDFVSYFLLTGKRGYCTYFASAMAVMARMAGLPSRYAEGYMVPANASGETLVRGENAHAWVEIYFNGVGWIPFDPTPGDRGDPDDNDPRSDATPTPSPTPSPTPEPTRDPEGNMPPDEATPTPEPTPEPELPDGATPTPQPTPNPNQSGDANRGNWWKALLIVLLALLLILLVVWLIRRRWMATDPGYLSRKQRDEATRLMLWYRTILTFLQYGGFAPEGGETPEQFALRVIRAGAAPKGFMALAQSVEDQQYAGSLAEKQAVQQARDLYRQMVNKLPRKNRLRWQVYRLIHGTGDFSQIP